VKEMFRFVCIAWNERARDEKAVGEALAQQLLDRSPDWRLALKASGLHVYCAGQDGSHGILALDGQGIVLGTLRRRIATLEGRATGLKHLTEAQSREIIDSGGKALIETYWGNYVAVLCGRLDPAIRVLRDPTGSLPCFVMKARGLTIVFSCIADIAALGFTFTPNPSYLESRLILESNPYERDALVEVSRVHGGECLSIDYRRDATGRFTREFYWTPSTFQKSDHPIHDPAEAAEAMRSIVRGATHSLARQHDNLLLRLSGGLDSSIVAGCLREMAPERQVTCYTYFTPRGRSSELPWARLAAAHCGLAHVECAVTAEDLDLSLLESTAPTVNPPIGLMHLQKITLETQLTEAMELGRGELAEASGAPVEVIGYPGGRCDDRVAAAARTAGFRVGYSTERAPVTPSSDPLLLGRIGPSLHTVGALALELAFTLVKRESGRPTRVLERAPS